MEVDLPNGAGDSANVKPTPADIKKNRMSASGDANLGDGDSEAMNGLNGNHSQEAEEPMDAREEGDGSSNGSSSNGVSEENGVRNDTPIDSPASSESLQNGDEKIDGEGAKDTDSNSKDSDLSTKDVDSVSKDGESNSKDGDSSTGTKSDDRKSEDSVPSKSKQEEVIINDDSNSSGKDLNSVETADKDSVKEIEEIESIDAESKPEEIESIDAESKPATPSTIQSEESKPASPSDKSKDPSTDREITKPKEPTEEEKRMAKDVAQREEKIKRIENSAKDNDDLRPVAKLLFGIGVDLAAQHIYKDLVRAQSKKDSQKKLDSKGQEQLEKLKSTFKTLHDRNKTYSLKNESCDKCGFKTESKNVIEWHLEFAHGQDNGRYECSFCDFETKLPAPFFFHMEAEHARKGRVFMKKAYFSCPQCPYENNSKHAVTKHRIKCDRQFNLKRNQEPLPTDCDIPLKKPKSLVIKPPLRGNKPQPMAVKNGNANIKIMPNSAKMNNATVQSILSQSRANQMSQSAALAAQRARMITPSTRPQIMGPGGQMFTVVNQPVMIPQNIQRLSTPTQGQGQYMPPNQNISQIAQQVVAQVTQQQGTAQQQKAIQEILKRAHNPPVVIPPPAAQRPPYQAPSPQNTTAANNAKFEICEICGGFVKDRESLRIHFYWAHKVDIQKDVFSRLNPHLKCDACPQAFWTYQGLARHRTVTHGRSNKRSYRCYLCGAKNIDNIITHLSVAHNVKLNTMYKTGKCLVCGLGFAGEKGLKRHIHTAHAELLKGQPDVVEEALKPQKSAKAITPKPTGNPVPTGLYENAAKKKKFEPVCSICNIVFPSVDAFSYHCNKMHVFKCWRCSEKWASKDLLFKHWHDKHRRDMEPCVLCGEQVTIGRPFVRHMKHSHMKQCSVVLIRMPQKDVDHYMQKAKDRLEREAKEREEKEKNKPQQSVEKKEVVIVLSDDEDTPKKKPNESKNEEAKKDDAIVVEVEKEEVEAEKEEVEAEKEEEIIDDESENQDKKQEEEIQEKEGEMIEDEEIMEVDDAEDEGEKENREEGEKEKESVNGEENGSENGDANGSGSDVQEVQEVMEVDGEKIVVEISQDDEDKESEAEDKESEREDKESEREDES